MQTTTATSCNACGRPAATDFCTRPDCLTYGSGAVAATTWVSA